MRTLTRSRARQPAAPHKSPLVSIATGENPDRVVKIGCGWRRGFVLIAAMVAVLSIGSSTASASATDCFSYGYDCTPGYTGSNASSSWAWRYYGGSWASTPNGYHNCTLYAAWRLYQSGMRDPGKSWGNASQWASSIGGGNHTPAVGAIAWWGSGDGHVAYVEQ